MCQFIGHDSNRCYNALQHLNKADDNASAASGEFMQPMIYGRTSALANYRNLQNSCKSIEAQKMQRLLQFTLDEVKSNKTDEI